MGQSVIAEISKGYTYNVISLAWEPAVPGGGGGAGLTDAQLRATPVPTVDTVGNVSLASLASTVDTNLALRVDISSVGGLAQPVDVSHGVSGLGTIRVELPSDGTGKVGLNAGTALVGKVGIDQTTPGTTNAVQANAGTNLNTSLLALETTQGAGNTLTGAVTEAAPATDTASSGLNGRLQRIAQRLTSLIALLPAALVGGRLDTNIGGLAGTATSVNSGTKDAGTLRVVLATDQPALTNKLLVTPDSVALPANQSVNAAQLAGTATSVNSGTKDAGTLRVVIATDQPALTNKLLVTPDSVALPANQSVNVAQMGGVATSMNTGVRDTGTLRVTIATNDVVPVTPPTLTKGTQGATGFSTQDLKDGGRNLTIVFMAAPIITTVAEVMQTFVAYKGGAAVGATATPAVVTAGKTYRIQSIEIHYTAATVIGGALVRMRALSSGVALIGSPLVKTFQVGVPAIFTAGAMYTYIFEYPDGLEFAAGFGVSYGVQGVGADGTTGTITGKIMIVVNGFEY